MKFNRDQLYLIYIAECIHRIEDCAAEGKDAFLSNDVLQDAVLRNLQTLAESTQRLSGTIKFAHRDVPWRNLAGLRNLLVHDYLGLDMNFVWAVVEQDLPSIKEKIQTILHENKNP